MNTHLNVFSPLRETLQFFGRAKSFDWPPLLLFAIKNPDQSSFV